LTIAQQKQRSVRMGKLNVANVAQRQRLDQILVAIVDVSERTKGINRLLRAQRRGEVLELVILLKDAKKRRQRTMPVRAEH